MKKSTSVDHKRQLLEDAIKAVSGESQLNYGAPEDNFKRIATLWNAWFTITDRAPLMSPIQPWEVAILISLMKDARLANNPSHRDSWLDKAGYAACGADIIEGADYAKR
jgi:Domain of unknown function (DUF6378)